MAKSKKSLSLEYSEQCKKHGIEMNVMVLKELMRAENMDTEEYKQIHRLVGKTVKTVVYDGMNGGSLGLVFTDGTDLSIEAEGDECAHNLISISEKI